METFKRTLLLVFVVILATTALQAKKLHTFPELFDPFAMQMDDQYLYVSQKTDIMVYSLKDFKLVTKFGKHGEGPGEMLPFANMGVIFYLQEDGTMVVNSQTKIMIYTKKGKYIREIPRKDALSQIPLYQPIGDNWVGTGIAMKEGKMHYTFNIFDGQMKKTKELARKFYMDIGARNLPLPQEPPIILVYKDKFFMPGPAAKGLNLQARNWEGKVLNSITYETKPIKLTEQFKKDNMAFMKKVVPEAQFAFIKQMTKFKEHFPTYMTFIPREDKLYVMTYENKDGKYKLLIFSQKGKLLKQTMVPFDMIDGVRPAPFDVKDNTFYQLVENIDDETFELHAYKL